MLRFRTMNRAIGRLVTGIVMVSIMLFGAPVIHAETVGGETWTSDLRIRTVADETERDRWTLDIRVFDRSPDRQLLSRSVTVYTDRTSDLTIDGLDQRQYRFSITVRRSALEARLEIRSNGEPLEYVRSIYEREQRQELSSFADSNVLRVGGRVLAPQLIRRVEPDYPPEAKAYRVSGVVIVEATIDETGAVRRTRVVKGLPFGLSESATQAVRQWRFKPATMDGEPVSVVHNVSVEFNLHKAGD